MDARVVKPYLSIGPCRSSGCLQRVTYLYLHWTPCLYWRCGRDPILPVCTLTEDGSLRRLRAVPDTAGSRSGGLQWRDLRSLLMILKRGCEFLRHYRGNRVRLIMFLISLPFVNVRISSVREFSGGRSRNPYTQWTHWWLTPFIINHSTANPIRFLNLFI